MHKYHYEHISSNSIEELVAKANEWAAEGFRLVHVARGFSGQEAKDNTDYWQGIVEVVDAAVREIPDLSELDEDAQTVYKKLVEVARNRDTITYGEIGALIRRAPFALVDVLIPIFEHDHNAGRPPIGSLVVSGRTNMPESGFFVAARAADMDVGSDEQAFWERCRDEVHAYWAQ